MNGEEALFSLKVTAGFGALFLAGFILTHLTGGYPHQPPWSAFEACRGLVICTLVPAGMGALTYAYQFNSSREAVNSIDVTIFAVAGLLVWASLTVWHIFRITHSGWPGLDQNTLIVVPWIAFILQPVLFWFRKGSRAYWGLVSGAMLLVVALIQAMIELNDLFTAT